MTLEQLAFGLDPPNGLSEERGATFYFGIRARLRHFWKKALNDIVKGF